MAKELESPRVLLREWRDDDLAPWITLNSDPINLKYFPRTYTPEESTASFQRIRERLDSNDFGLWAAEEKSSGNFMGFVGIASQNLDGVSFMPCHEIGWRLDKEFWGRGYATEAAKVALDFALNELHIPVIYSYTAIANEPSINVMRKIGLHFRPDLEFDHPNIPEGSPVKRHLVYSTMPA